LKLLLILLWTQCFWLIRTWRLVSGLEYRFWRQLLHGAIVSGFGFVVLVLTLTQLSGGIDFAWRYSGLAALVGFWVTSALIACLAIHGVLVVNWIIGLARPQFSSLVNRRGAAHPTENNVDLNRRRFVQAATIVAGAIPLGAGGYGFAIGRHNYQVNEIDLPVDSLRPELRGLRIAQLSDVHIGSYMSAAEVQRVVAMTNELRPDLTVVTGDFITGPNDPLEQCVAELSRLRAPLGVWGCNGNHEVYADAEWLTPELFQRYGMRLLRRENVELAWEGQKFNLIGVDYQRSRDLDGQRLLMLNGAESLTRCDMTNILLSHNPNSFPRAAELGIQLTLAGHTHGGQITVEILDHGFNPARFFTPYVAGLYRRPLGSAAYLDDKAAWSGTSSGRSAVVYVNRGLGTIVAPVRLGVPPEISLFTLCKARSSLVAT